MLPYHRPSLRLLLYIPLLAHWTSRRCRISSQIAPTMSYPVQNPNRKQGRGQLLEKAKARAQRNRRAKAKTKAVTSLRGKAKVAKAQASRVASQKTGCPPCGRGAKVQTRALEEKQVTKDGPLASQPEDGNDEPKALQLVLEFGRGDAFVGILPTFAVWPFCP